MQTLMPFVQEVAFPIVVTLYLLHRIEGKLDKLNNSVTELPQRMHSSSDVEKQRIV
ncbi:YvrJ family protein [Bacillus tianshenii]|nr:YvrJ family protein [Bacillus tianshenii]